MREDLYVAWLSVIQQVRECAEKADQYEVSKALNDLAFIGEALVLEVEQLEGEIASLRHVVVHGF